MIRETNLAEKDPVPFELRKTYSRHGIEERLKNPLYWGHFYLTGDQTRYEGQHELIIPTKTLRAVENLNTGNVRKNPKSFNAFDDIFRRWLVCDHPECQRLITYEKKMKTLKGSGEKKIYHLYRCSNSRKIHDKYVYISEDKLWDQFEPAAARFDISEDFASDIMKALDESFDKQQLAIKKQMEGFRIALKELEGREDALYVDLKKNVLEESHYHRQIRRIREERADYNVQLEHLRLLISDSGKTTVKKV